MGKCKNTDCGNETKDKNIYCSLTCRNVYVNKHLRDYSKNAAGLSEEKQYYENPKKCKSCFSILSYAQRNGKYCGHSCSASEGNMGRTQNEKTKNKISKALIKNTTISCKYCGTELLLRNRRKFCSELCLNSFRRRDMSDFAKYKQDCLFTFNLSYFEEEFDFDLIIKFGWYKPVNRGNNLNGISRDHLYSIRDGFDNKVDPKIIAHPANCRLILQRENSSKHKKSSITLDDLKHKIEIWNQKYGAWDC